MRLFSEIFESRQLNRIERKLDVLLRRVNFLMRETFLMAVNLDSITAQVTKTTDAQDSAVLLLGDLKARLDAAGTDPVALQALSDALSANTDNLAAAIVANTPAA